MNRTVSQKFRFFTFISITLLVYVHGYNLNETYLAPYSGVKEPLNITTYLEYLFANGLLRFRIPMLFMISGYIYAMHDERPYSSRIKSRFRSLMIPYLIWSAVGLLVTYIWQHHPITAEAVLRAQLDQMGDNRPYEVIGWLGILERWLFVPISFQLWFILALFIYNLIYPLIRWCVENIPVWWLLITFLVWFFLVPVPIIDGRGLFFFSAGVWLQKKNISLEKKPKWFSLGMAWIFYIGLNIIKTFMAFELALDKVSSQLVLVFLYNLSIIAGVMALWFSSDKLVKWVSRQKWFGSLASYSFFIFGLHVPILFYFMNLALIHLNFLPNYRLFCYLFVPLFTVFFSILVGAIIKKLLPSVYRLMTGGRGLA